jgi:hypothetical protein
VAFVSGLRLILVIGMVLVAIGAVVAVALIRAKDFVHPPAAQMMQPEEPMALFDA